MSENIFQIPGSKTGGEKPMRRRLKFVLFILCVLFGGPILLLSIYRPFEYQEISGPIDVDIQTFEEAFAFGYEKSSPMGRGHHLVEMLWFEQCNQPSSLENNSTVYFDFGRLQKGLFSDDRMTNINNFKHRGILSKMIIQGDLKLDFEQNRYDGHFVELTKSGPPIDPIPMENARHIYHTLWPELREEKQNQYPQYFDAETCISHRFDLKREHFEIGLFGIDDFNVLIFDYEGNLIDDSFEQRK